MLAWSYFTACAKPFYGFDILICIFLVCNLSHFTTLFDWNGPALWLKTHRNLTQMTTLFSVISPRDSFWVLQSLDSQYFAIYRKTVHILNEEDFRFEFANLMNTIVNILEKN